jgi:tetratricopeptide (TPR) repeat protein
LEAPPILQRLQEAVRCHRAGDLQQAEQGYRDVLTADPLNLEATRLLGILEHQLGRDEQAVQLFERVLEAQPDLAEVHVNLAKALKRLGRLEQAAASYRKAVALQPEDAKAHYNLGNVLREMDLFDEAAASYWRAVVVDPRFIEARVNLGMVLKLTGRLHEALATYHDVLAIEPGLGECRYNLGLALNDMGKLDEAIAELRRVLDQRWDYADAHFGLALTLLLKGDYSEGWKEYEWRWLQEEHQRLKRKFRQPRWDGSPLDGRTILLYAEQGDGDTIQFIRYVSEVARLGGNVIVECQPALKSLFSSVAGIDVLIGKGEEIPEFDVHAPLLSLPHILGTTLATVPADVPYVLADGDARVELSLDPKGKNVGIVWAGSPAHRKDRQRSTQLERFIGLSSVPDVALYSLQLGDRRRDLQAGPGCPIVDLGDHLQDYSDTAAVIDQLDLVITVDTSVAHLAGAMGKKVWVLLPHAPDFRWMLHRSDSPWYPTMTLFRQPEYGDWEGVFRAVESALRRL